MKKTLFFLILIASINANAQCWSKISAGDYHTLALDVDGKLWAWGANYDGELGDGTTINRTTPEFINSSSWLDVSAGLSHSLGLKNDGTIWAWGRNGTGQLGTGTARDTNSLVQIGTGSDWTKIAAGANHSAAIKSDGTLWTWGSDEYGQLGNGGTNTALISPTKADSATDWQKVYAGEFNTFAIKQDGTLWGCGRNDIGQVGDGTKINKNLPVQIGTGTNWSEISVGKYFTVGLKTDGTLWAWGDNFYGQLGDGTNTGKTVPTQIGSATNWQIIACGPEHIVAQRTDGTVWAWGNGQNGALGINTDANFNTPKLVNITNLISISCGYYHSLVVKNDNKLWAWGTNASSQFGNGNSTQSLIPVEVACPATVGIANLTKNEPFKLFPNPVNDLLIIQNSSDHAIDKLRITELTGKTMMMQNSKSSELHVEQLLPGIYFLQITAGDKKSVVKFIKR